MSGAIDTETPISLTAWRRAASSPLHCFAWTGQVVHVADGDTITVTRDGKRVKDRLYGIDTPEKAQY